MSMLRRIVNRPPDSLLAVTVACARNFALGNLLLILMLLFVFASAAAFVLFCFDFLLPTLLPGRISDQLRVDPPTLVPLVARGTAFITFALESGWLVAHATFATGTAAAAGHVG